MIDGGTLNNYIDICVKLQIKLLLRELGKNYDVDEVRQECALGILKAMQKFDPSQSKEQTYCVNYGKWAIGQFVYRQKRKSLRELNPLDYANSDNDENATEDEIMDEYASQRHHQSDIEVPVLSLRQILEPLTPKQRECACIIYDTGKRKTLSELFGMVGSAAAGRMSKAQKALIEEYGIELFEDKIKNKPKGLIRFDVSIEPHDGPGAEQGANPCRSTRRHNENYYRNRAGK